MRNRGNYFIHDRSFWIRSLVLFLFLGVVIVWLVPNSDTELVYAQGDQSLWSPYERVPGYNDSTYPPILVADQNQTIHAFATQEVGEEKSWAIIYRQWSLVNYWSLPIDIILAPERVNVDGAFIDENGIIHLIFWQSGLYTRGLYYASASVSEAGSVNSWSEPLFIGDGPIEPSFGAIFGDGQKKLITLYNGSTDGVGIYAIQSVDGGLNWSDPTPIYFAQEKQEIPVYIKTSKGSEGKYHVVWNVVNNEGKDLTNYYAMYDLGNDIWSEPISIGDSSTQPAGFGTAFPVVFEQNGEITTVYNDGIPPIDVPPALYSKTSTNAGVTWIGPTRIFPEHIGRSGEHAGSIDSQGNYHLVFVQRIPIEINGISSAIGGMWHSVFDGNRWSEPEQVTVRGSRAIYAWHDVNVAISQGNIILAVWRVDPGLPLKGVWYSYKVLNTQELPVKLYPTEAFPTVQPAESALGEVETTSTSSQRDMAVKDWNQPQANDSKLGFSIIGGVVPVLIVILIFIGWRQYKMNK